ncbi:hypothetical protein TSUD_128040 [Trifolium subterraneum]|nr:hypothetical protein TSUD_128040 [Trifolium subterraneum]
MWENLTYSATLAVLDAQKEARFVGHKYISTEHILLGILGDSNGLAAKILKSCGIDVNVSREHVKILIGRGGGCSGLSCEDLRFTYDAKNVLDFSLKHAKSLGHEYVDTIHLLLGLLQGANDVVTQLLESQGSKNKMGSQVEENVHNDVTAKGSKSNQIKFPVVSQNNNLGAKKDENVIKQKPALEIFGTNLTKLAQEIICRRMKNNPCLVGEHGVGKTSIIHGLAQRILSGYVPEKLKGKRVITLDVADFLFVSNQGSSEERIKCLIKEIEQSGDVILFVKEVHHLFDAATPGARSFSYIFKHALERGVIQCIFATTVNEHRLYMENDVTLKRICQPVKVVEPSVEETVEILKGLRETYETHYKLHYTDEALVAAVNLSQQYLSDRFLPDKAIDLIDEAGSHNKKKGNASIPSVKKCDIQHVISSWIGVPVSDVSKEEGENLLNLEDILHKQVIGQDEGISTICRAIRRARVGLRNSRRPIASFMFTGPSGVGKTELANALATNYYGSNDSLIRLDMSEYMERHNAARLIGAPPGYHGFEEGGQLTEAVRKHSHAVVLFDEIEKAHSDVFNLMLQILDDGRLTDGKGQTVDFKSTVIIMTSNLGNNIIEGIDDKDSSFDHKKNLVMEELKNHFRPEFLNRLDEIIVFKQLTKLEVKQIANIMLREVCQKLKVKDINLSLTCRFRDYVIQHGYNPSYGARPLRRTIARFLEDTLAEKMLRKEIKEGDSIVVDVNDDEGNVIVLNKKNVKKEDLCTSFVDSDGGNDLSDEKRKMWLEFHVTISKPSISLSPFSAKKTNNFCMPSHKPRKSFQRTRTNMDQNLEKKPPKMNLNIPELDMMHAFKKHSHMLVSPTSHKAESRKTSGGRSNCLCSPTTHVGSFRCRLHRASAGLHRGGSVGSNLSELGNKAGAISDSLHAQ